MYAAFDTRPCVSISLFEFRRKLMSSFLTVSLQDPKLGLPGHEAPEDPAEAQLRKALND